MALRAIGERLPKITRPTLARRGRAFAAIVGEWPTIVGPRWAEGTQPEKLSGGPPGEGGVLTVRVAGAQAMELQHLGAQLVERVNSFVGHRAVARLRLVQAPLPSGRRPPPKAPADPRLSHAHLAPLDRVDDPELKAALARLAACLARQAVKS